MEYLDLVETARSTIDKRGQGEFVFGTVKGWLDCRFTERRLPFVEFSWEGLSEGDVRVGGDGQAFNPTRVSKGHLFIHPSDDSVLAYDMDDFRQKFARVFKNGFGTADEF